jgi:glycosyltransferase involved in cell wall biosynthesis
MNEQHSYRAEILPVPESTSRPLWSVMIPTYNCANYLRETLTSVLAQDLGPEVMQIEVVDDCSTQDDPAAVVQELGQGRVNFYQQPKNIGYIRNFATCLQRSRGHLVHLLHGDDCVLNGFYSKMQFLFKQHSEIGAAFCRHIIMDEHGDWQRFSRVEQPESGVLSHWFMRIATELPLQTPSMVVRREVYETLGGFDCRLVSCGEDWEMWVRIAAQYPVAYEIEPLALYRDRSNSLTKRSTKTGQNIRDVRTATDIVKSYLPTPLAKELNRKARKNWAAWALHYAEQFLAHRDRRAAMTQIREGLQCSRSYSTVIQAILLVLKIAKQWIV